MAGGQGTRFWPRSRRHAPKHLLSISGRHTLLQETVRRLLPLFSWNTILIVTNNEHAAEVRRQLPRVPGDHILIEPMGRNTAACIGLAAEWITARAPGAHAAEAVMVVAPADHVIKNTAAFRRTLLTACRLAIARECLVTLGIEPTRADTGYGYIEAGHGIDARTRDVHWVRRFHEKPSAAVAKRYVAGGRHLWNSGIFVWKTNVFRSALQRCAPEIAGPLNGLWAAKRGAAQRVGRAYRKIPAISVDIAVMQPITAQADAIPRVAVVRGRFDWNDVGSWVAMPEIWGCDKMGNAAIGTILPIDAHDSIVYSPARLVALVGVSDLIVVDSDDALLICPRDRAQDVRKVTQALRDRGWSRYL